MSDFNLIVGADIGLSLDQFRKDISEIITALNNDNLKIEIGVNTKPLENFATQLQEIQNTINNIGDTGTGNSFYNPNSLRRLYDLHRQMNDLTNKNKRAGLFGDSDKVFSELTTDAKSLNQVLELVEKDSISVSKAFKQLGLDSNKFIEKIETNISKFRDKMSINSKSGTANEKDLNNVVAQMQTLINKNPHLNGTESFEKLRNVMTSITGAINEARTGTTKLEIALERAGFDGASAIDEARLAISRFKSESAIASPDRILKVDRSNSSISSEYYKDVAELTRLKTELDSNLKNWSAAKGTEEYNAYKSIGSSIDDLRGRLETGTLTARKYAESHGEIVKNMKNSEIAVEATGKAHKSLDAKLGANIKKFTEWFGGAQAVMMAVRYFKEMIQKVIELDTAMTELKKVTDATDEAYEKFLVGATQRAKQLGSTVTDIVGASSTFARLGFDLGESEQLADAAIVYKNVGDGIENIDQASESIIATMQAYGIEAENVMSIIDKFNEVGNNYAISSSGVGDALLRSAAAMKAAGNTIDETIALAAASNTIVQDPEKVGGVSPNDIVICRKKIGISVKDRRRLRPRKDFVVYTRGVRISTGLLIY